MSKEKNVRIRIKQPDGTYITVHPETQATITKYNSELPDVDSKNVHDALDELITVVATKANSEDLVAHTNNIDNPHQVTKSQVGLGNVDNTSDLNKPISADTQDALNGKVSDVKVNNKSVVTDMVANIVINDATLAIQKNGTEVGTFTANAASDSTIDITVPTTTNELTNNSGFITKSVDDLDNYTTTASLNDALDTKVNKTGDETISGTKTFTSGVVKITNADTIEPSIIIESPFGCVGHSISGFILDYDDGNGTYLSFPTLEENDTIATASQVSSKADANGGVLTNADISATSLEIDNTEIPIIKVNGVNYYFDGTSGTLENQNNKVTTLSAQSTNAEYPSAKAVYDNTITPINNINSKIPSQATSENQLADKNFVNSSIATNTAYFKGTYDVVSDLGLTVSATHEQVAVALGTTITGATNNDYCFVSIPSTTQVGDVDEYDRYKYDGTSWVFEYSLNNSSFTSDQWAAINSGITPALVGQITTNKNNITQKADDSSVVHNTGNETIGGHKIFSDSVAIQGNLYTEYLEIEHPTINIGDPTGDEGYIEVTPDSIYGYNVALEQVIDLTIPATTGTLATTKEIKSISNSSADLQTVLSTGPNSLGTYCRLMPYNDEKMYLWLDNSYRILTKVNGKWEMSSESSLFTNTESDETHEISEIANAFGILSPNNDGRVIVFFRCHGTRMADIIDESTGETITEEILYYSIRAKVSNTDGTFDISTPAPSTVMWSTENDEEVNKIHKLSDGTYTCRYYTNGGTISVCEPWADTSSSYVYFSKIRHSDTGKNFVYLKDGNYPANDTCQDICKQQFTITNGTISSSGTMNYVINGYKRVDMDGVLNKNTRVGMVSFTKIKDSTNYLGIVESSVNSKANKPRPMCIQLFECRDISYSTLSPTSPKTILLPDEGESRGAPYITTLDDGRIVISFMSSQEFTGNKNEVSSFNRVWSVYVSKIPITSGMLDILDDNLFVKLDFNDFSESQWGRWGSVSNIDGNLYKTFTYGYNDNSGTAHRYGNLVIYEKNNISSLINDLENLLEAI